MEIEKLTTEDLTSVKGGIWVLIDDRWAWIDTLGYDPEEEDI